MPNIGEVKKQDIEIRLLKRHVKELEQDNPVLNSRKLILDKCVETIEETPLTNKGDEIVHPFGKPED